MEKILRKGIFCVGLLISCIATVYSQENGVIATERGEQKGVISFLSEANVDLGDGKYVDGYAKKYGAGAFLYPVGDGGVLRPFSATGDQVVGAYFRVSPNVATLPTGAPFSVSARTSDLSMISGVEYWDIDGANSSKITLTWDESSGISSLVGTDLEKLTIAGWNPYINQWTVIASTVDVNAVHGGASNISTGSITSNNTLEPSFYTVYTLAGLKSNPLPVELVSFTAMLAERYVYLDWTTTEEQNTRNFEVQRSSNGRDWIAIGTVLSAGSSLHINEYQFVDKQPLTGANVYRLKMVDRDRTFAYSKLVAIDSGGGVEIYPNPAQDYVFVKAQVSNDPVSTVSVTDMSGKSVIESGDPGNGGINVSLLATGTYVMQVRLTSGNKISHKIVIVR